jgi:endoglucanase
LEDVLDILTGNRIGFALWNFRGTFGILDSNRKDVKYKDWHGHKLDRGLLDLLRKF